MAIRIIRTLEDDILYKKSKEVTLIDSKLLTLLDDMYDTMVDANGVGLAAPQIGILRRVVIIDIGEGLVELINPVILETNGEQIGDEGCLSVPGKNGTVKRPNYCKVEAINREGNKFIIEGEEFMARALCHEIDHLEGKLYIDLVDGDLNDNSSYEE
ncbi:MAG: peptide deformylase [bacterium]